MLEEEAVFTTCTPERRTTRRMTYFARAPVSSRNSSWLSVGTTLSVMNVVKCIQSISYPKIRFPLLTS